MRIFVCSQYSGDVVANVETAKRYCNYVFKQGHSPFAPHLLYPQMLNDKKPAERELGISAGLDFLEACDEVWVFGMVHSEGMAMEIKHAEMFGVPVVYLGDKA